MKRNVFLCLFVFCFMFTYAPVQAQGDGLLHDDDTVGEEVTKTKRAYRKARKAAHRPESWELNILVEYYDKWLEANNTRDRRRIHRQCKEKLDDCHTSIGSQNMWDKSDNSEIPHFWANKKAREKRSECSEGSKRMNPVVDDEAAPGGEQRSRPLLPPIVELLGLDGGRGSRLYQIGS